MFEFLCTDTKTFDDDGSQLYQTGLIQKFLEATVMDNSNGQPTLTKIYSNLGKNDIFPEAKIYWHNSYEFFIGMMLYILSN